MCVTRDVERIVGGPIAREACNNDDARMNGGRTLAGLGATRPRPVTSGPCNFSTALVFPINGEGRNRVRIGADAHMCVREEDAFPGIKKIDWKAIKTNLLNRPERWKNILVDPLVRHNSVTVTPRPNERRDAACQTATQDRFDQLNLISVALA